MLSSWKVNVTSGAAIIIQIVVKEVNITACVTKGLRIVWLISSMLYVLNNILN